MFMLLTLALKFVLMRHHSTVTSHDTDHFKSWISIPYSTSDARAAERIHQNGAAPNLRILDGFGLWRYSV